MKEVVPSAERWKRTGVKAWAIIGVLLLVAAAGWLLSAISSALVPFGFGLVIVLLLRHPVDRLGRKMNRSLAVALCYLLGIAAVTVALIFIVPPVAAQISAFAQALPGYLQVAYRWWDVTFVHPSGGSAIPSWLQDAMLSLKDQLVSSIGAWSSTIASTALSAGGSIANGVVSFLLALMIGFFALVELPKLKTEVYALAGPSWRDEIQHASRTLTRVMGGWLRGTLIQSTAVAILFSIGFSIVGVPYALALGVIGGILNIVPYVGPTITGVLAAAAGLFVSPVAAMWAVAVVVTVQQIDSLLVAPRVMSSQVDLHPLLIIFALLVGAALFGTWGMVLSVPVAAILKATFVFWYEKRAERQITSDEGVLFPTARDEPSSGATGS